MKKFLAMLLASTMVLGLSVPAFAANEATANAESENKATINVTGKYEEEYIDADTVISVDVAWDSMEFTYAAGGYQGEWNPGDHSYSGGNSSGWVKNTSDITVTNHSNAEVTAAFTFAKDDAFSDGEVEFKQNDSAVTAVDLATAVGTTKENAPKQTVTFAIIAGSIAANGNLGTITVAISEKKSEAKLQLATTYYYVSATASADDMDMSKAVFRYVDEKEQWSEITGATDGVTIVTTGKKGSGRAWDYSTQAYVEYTTEEFTVTYKKLTKTFTVCCYTSTPPQMLPSDVSALPPVNLTKEQIANVTAAEINATTMSADALKTTLASALEEGKTDLKITLAADADKAMTTAIFEAITESGAADGSLSLTLNGITTIAEEAFREYSYDEWSGENTSVYMTQVCTLTLTDVTSIGAYGFSGCENLTTLTAPKLETVGECAFSRCALSVIDLPTLTTMGAMAFSNMKNIKKINLPSVTEISVWAFNYCTFADDAQIILTGLNAGGTFNDYWGSSTYTDFFTDNSTKNVNLTLSNALASQVNENVWTVPRKSGASYVPSYTFKAITLVDNSAE